MTTNIDVHHNDIVIYDTKNYAPLKKYLKNQNIQHILLTKYTTDIYFYETTTNYQNLSKNFNVFLIKDTSLTTFPTNRSPQFTINATISFTALNHLITQVS